MIGKALPFQFGNGYLIVLSAQGKIFIAPTIPTLLGLHPHLPTTPHLQWPLESASFMLDQGGGKL